MLAVFFSLDLPSARGREMDSRILMQKKKKKNTSLSASKFTAGEPNTGTSDYGVTQNTLSQSTTHLELRMCLREINNISSKGSRRKHQSSPKNILRHDGGFNTSPRVPAAYLVA